jgi:nitric oxide dioxygenase
MLSEAARPYIAASVPVLREHGASITRTFYAQLFAAHPELTHVFNMGNQQSGAQQNALASALVAYAANIDQAAALAPVIDRIAHKHAAVGIKPAHYPIVARHLLGAIRTVLGEAATPELLAAWDEAYWLLAGELIAAEARLYQRAGAEPGALRPLTVARVEPHAAGVTSYYLQHAGGSPGAFEPGQYVSVAVELPGGKRQLRQYSLSDAPSKPHWRISVKREPASPQTPEGQVSSHLHAQLRPGQVLQVSAPYGNFTPLRAASSRPLAFVSAGVGITPLLSALHTLAETDRERPLLFAHAAQSGRDQLFASELARAQERLPRLRQLTFHERDAATHAHSGRMQLDAGALAGFEDADFFLCGPAGFMREQWRALVSQGVSPLRIEREVFGPDLLEHLA